MIPEPSEHRNSQQNARKIGVSKKSLINITQGQRLFPRIDEPYCPSKETHDVNKIPCTLCHGISGNAIAQQKEHHKTTSIQRVLQGACNVQTKKRGNRRDQGIGNEGIDDHVQKNRFSTFFRNCAQNREAQIQCKQRRKNQ